LLYVIKRNGEKVIFEEQKIFNAIKKAREDYYENNEEIIEVLNDETIKGIVKIIYGKAMIQEEPLTVEDIQNMVEEELMSCHYYHIARLYIRYRHRREMARGGYAELIKTVKEKLTAANVENQNANVDEKSFGGRMGETSDAVTRHYATEYLLSETAKENHFENMIYIHDLSHYAVGDHNCLSIPFDDLLKNGFNTRQTDVRPANSVGTAFQLIAVIFQLQSLQQFGGVSATHLDWTMVPYVRKSFYKHFNNGVIYIEKEKYWMDENLIPEKFSIEDVIYHKHPEAYKYAMDMTTKEIQQAVEGMYHNLNTLQSRSGNQLPFTSINYGTCTLPEGRMIIKALLEGSIKGVGKFHKTSIFPCGIFQCMKGVNRHPGDPNYDMFKLALKSTAQRLYPNYANVDWSGNAGYDVNDPTTYFSTMGK
jgi:ribonucleoside-triphosphate reductase